MRYGCIVVVQPNNIADVLTYETEGGFYGNSERKVTEM